MHAVTALASLAGLQATCVLPLRRGQIGNFRRLHGHGRDPFVVATPAALGHPERAALERALPLRRDPATVADDPEDEGLPRWSERAGHPARSTQRKHARPVVEQLVARHLLGTVTPLQRHYLALRLYRDTVRPDELTLLDCWRVEATRLLCRGSGALYRRP